MRRFPLRSFIFILLITALATASLSFQEFRLQVAGIDLERGEKSPRGLRLGLDLEGGSHLVYKTKLEDGDQEPTDEQMEGVLSIIERRVNAFGVSEPSIQRMGPERILIQLPGVGVTKANIVFSEAIPLEELKAVFDSIDRSSVSIDSQDSLSYDVELPSLEPARFDSDGQIVKVAERDLIEVKLRTAFPDIDILYSISGGVEEAKKLIGQTAQLEIKERICKNDPSDLTQRCENPEYHVDNDLGLTGEDLALAYAGVQPNTGLPVVNIEFNGEGTRIFAEHTSRIAGTNNRTAFFLDNELVIDPIAVQAITGGRAYIQGPDFTPESVRTVAIQLESGRLPIPLVLIQEKEVDATLGEDSLRKSLVAGLIGLGLVLFFMAAYYRLPGIIACIALIIYGIIVLAILKLWPITLTLGGIAAFILSIGMAVDANILIFERMKEEIRSGRILIASLDTGFNRAWPAIRDSNVSTFITCAILFWFGTRLGTGVVTGFALTLFIGVSISMFSALIVTRTFLRIVAITPFGRMPSVYTNVRQNVSPEEDSTGSRERR